MSITRNRGAIAILAAVALLALAGTATAANGSPPKNPPRYGQGQGGGGVMAGGVVMSAAASYLGISQAELQIARHAGKSLAQIAADRDKSVSGLEAALVKAFEANLDKAVDAGRITEAQASQALATFKAQVDTAVSRTATGPMAGRGRGAGMGLGLCGGRR